MFGLSTWEILVILAVALIFIGPDQLPKVARQIGKGVRQVRGAMGKVDTEMRRAVREATAELEREDDDARDDDAAAPTPVGTIQPPADATTSNAPPDGAKAPDAGRPLTRIERDWSQVGKTPPAGRVATAGAARPRATPPEPRADDAAPAEDAAADTTPATTTTTTTPPTPSNDSTPTT